MEIMNVIEKTDFIHSYLHYASENTIDEAEFFQFYATGQINPHDYLLASCIKGRSED